MIKFEMNEDIEEFFKNSSVRNLVYKQSELDYIMTKIKINDRFDLIYDGHGVIFKSSSTLDLIGVLDNTTNTVYACDYFKMISINKLIPDMKVLNVSDVINQLSADIEDEYNRRIYAELDYFYKLGDKAFNKYISYERNKVSLDDRAYDRYVKDGDDYKIRFKCNLEESYYYKQRSWLESLLESIEDRQALIDGVINQTLNEKRYINSDVCGIEDIEVTQAEHIGYMLLCNIYINQKVQELFETDKGILTKKREIYKAVSEDKKMVNITIVHNTEELTFKYPVNYLRTFSISSWHIPDTGTRKKFDNLFADKYYYDDLIVQKIVKITYGKQVLYSGEDISDK